jgi:cbb3-type cytochrome c oxidase subunit III
MIKYALIALVGLAAAPAALAAGDAAAGQTKAAVCAACHGVDGNSVNPEWPSIAGQHPGYIASQLHAYKDGKRENVLMSPQAMALSEEDIADLAAYFSGQGPSPREADPELASRGEQLYRGGDPERGIAACIACHGPNGRGNPAAGYPVIAGQHSVYAAAQLRLYASGERRSDPNQMMRSIARRMTEEDIRAVSAYVQGLR